jgi:hypothetical protein
MGEAVREVRFLAGKALRRAATATNGRGAVHG